MSVYLNQFSISAGLECFTKHAAKATERIGEITFNILDGTTTLLGRLLPDLRPTSVGEVILQLKQTGSAWFDTPKGFILVEINRDQDGLFILKASSEFFKTVIIREGKKSHSGALWEVEVSNYLQKIVKNSTSVSYGETASRWKGDKFAVLKEYYSREGMLRNTGHGVMLKLPGEKPLTFADPHADLKAEIVLKHFYQMQKTPMEEEQSKHWDTLNRLFVGYLYFSGYALAPWVNDHVMLPHHRALREEERANRMAADGFLDSEELTEMAKSPTLQQYVMDIAEAQADQGNTSLLSQLENVSFRSNGYTQTYEYDGKSVEENHVFSSDKEVHSKTVCPDRGSCEEYITEQSKESLVFTQKKHGYDKIEVQKANYKREGDGWKLVNEERYEEGRVLRLPDRSFASTILAQSQVIVANTATVYFAALITKTSPKIAIISSLFQFISQAEAFASSKPISEVRQVKEIRSDSAVKAKGALARRTAPISINIPLPDLTATIGQPLVEYINLQQSYQLSNPNSNLDLSIQQTNNAPGPSWLTMNMGTISLLKSFYMGNVLNVVISGNYAYVLDSGGNLFQAVDISNPANPVIVDSYNLNVNNGPSSSQFYVKGNYLFYLDVNDGLEVLDITNPSNITFATSSRTANSNYYITLSGNYVYMLQYDNNPSHPQNYCIMIKDITNSLNPIQKSVLALATRPATLQFQGPAYVSGNFAYIPTVMNYGSPSLLIVNVANPSAPTLAATLTYSANLNTPIVQGNYLYVPVGTNINIYNTTKITNLILLNTVYLGVTPSGQQTTATALAVSGNYLYATCGTEGIQVINIEDVHNSYIVATINTPGTANNAVLSGNNIFTADGQLGLTIYNAAERILSGTPSAQNRGLVLLNVTASDDLGDTLVEPIAIHVGNVNVLPISNQQVYVGNATLFTLAPGTFDYPGAAFTYRANLIGGLPLPPFISFNSNTRTFVFAPESCDQNTYSIVVTADDGYGGTSTATFTLSVPDRLPVVQQPLSDQTAYTSQPFVYAFNNSTFTDADNDVLSYTARSVGSLSGLPGWLNFDPVLRQFYGTPFGKGVYPIQVTANDNNGGTVSNTFTISVPSSPPVVVNPPGTQVAGTGIPFTYTFNSNTFYDVDNDPLTYTSGLLPAFLTFNPTTRTFSGTPQSGDIGTYTIVLTAQASGGTISTTFTLSVLDSANNNPPVLIKQIPDLTTTSGTAFNTTIAPGTFIDPQGLNLTYTATLEGGAQLPTGLNFDPNTLTFSGIVAVPQALRITVKVTDTSGLFAIDTFTLTVLDGTKYPPVVLNPLSDEIASVGASFSKNVPQNTFKDINQEELSITVMQSGGLPLPEWLKWDPVKLSFSGTPGSFDTDTYSPRKVTIDVWAADSVGSVKTSFIITVGGESFWAAFIKYGFSFVSVAGSALGVWNERALIWNHFNKKKYQKDSEKAFVGHPYAHIMNVEREHVKEVKVTFKGKPLTLQKPFPSGLSYENDQLIGIPTGKDIGRFTVRVIDHDDYIREEFDLIIKNNDKEPDPEIKPKPTYLESAKMQLSDLRSRYKEGDEGQSCFGKLKERLPKEFPMKNLGKHESDV